MADAFTRPERKALAVVEKHAKSRDSLVLALIKALLGLWGGFDQWQDRDMVTGHAARSTVLVDAYLGKTRRLARSYASTMLSIADAMPSKPLPPVEDVYPRSGSTQVEVYSRPAEQYLYAIKRGLSESDAREAAERRLVQLAETDIMLVERDETQRTYSRSSKVIGRRRIIHPELAESGFSCGLCVVAADRIYSSGELMPIHDHCNCTDALITTGFDPGLKLNRADLDEFYATANGSTFADELIELRVTTNEHGELGPILRRDGQNFRDHTDASTSRKQFTPFERRNIADQRKSWQDMIDSSTRAVELLTAARDRNDSSVELTNRGQKQSVTDFNTALKYHRDLMSRYRQRLAR